MEGWMELRVRECKEKKEEKKIGERKRKWKDELES